ncbi:MAG: 3-deoxy-manno-octulosonate cytidylyltransferase [Methylococcaceae bacterium]|nr:3-deoxy-manno-octulosonate cytidylyltransferase [Methylococcaceae bacterium]
MTHFRIVIPARYGSLRLPAKPLLPIAGKPMILHVCDRAREVGADQVIVATDHEEILACVEDYGVCALMTRKEHRNGTERIAEVCDIQGWDDSDIVVNLQGDEPLVPAAMIRGLALALESATSARVATLATAIDSPQELFDPNAVKVVVDRAGHALYFSRAPIPWDRDRFSPWQKPHSLAADYRRHIGMYAYSVAFLHRYKGWPTGDLEGVEKLEQLRILWHGERILVIPVESAPEAGVDTREDLVRVERALRHGGT